MDFDTYKTHVKNNAAIVKRCLDTRTTDVSGIVFWEGIKGSELSFDELMSKWSDILGCGVIGALPSAERRGADGYIYYKGLVKPHAIESKVCGIRQHELALGVRGGLYYSTNLENYNSKSGITSYFAGAFDAKMTEETFQSKKRDTFLIPFDKTANQVIDVYRIDGDTVLRLLEDRKNNSSITLKLSAFQQSGHRFNSEWEVDGFNVWSKNMSTLAKQNKRFVRS